MKSLGEIRSGQRARRHRRIRKRVKGTPERPRLAVYRSLRHVYAQLIDDVAARTLASASTRDKQASSELTGADSRIDRSKVVGRVLAQRALEKGVQRVAFDRGGYLYHGHIKAVADGARDGGLEF